jgi:hypothetical protein
MKALACSTGDRATGTAVEDPLELGWPDPALGSASNALVQARLLRPPRARLAGARGGRLALRPHGAGRGLPRRGPPRHAGHGLRPEAGPTKAAWPSGGPRSADAEVLQDLEKLRERARINGRIDPVGSGIILNFVQEMVGQGINDRAATGDPVKDAAINAEWEEIRKNNLTPAELVDWFVAQLMIAERLSRTARSGRARSRASPTTRSRSSSSRATASRRRATSGTVLRRATPSARASSATPRPRRGVLDREELTPATSRSRCSTHGAAPLALTVRDFDRVTPEQAKHLRLPGRPGPVAQRDAHFTRSRRTSATWTS